MQHVFIIGSKGIPANYGGYETFVEKLTENQVLPDIKYHVACAVDSAEEVGHPEGQPIVETFPQLEGLVADGMRDLVAQQQEAAADPRRIAADVVKELPLAGITARQYGRYTEAVAEGARRALASVGLA